MKGIGKASTDESLKLDLAKLGNKGDLSGFQPAMVMEFPVNLWGIAR